MGSSVSKCDAAVSAPPLPPLEGSSVESSSIDVGELSAPEVINEDDAIAKAAASASAITNPGFLEHATQEVKQLIELDTRDGFRVDISKQLSPFFLVSHSFWLGTTMLQGGNKQYAFVPQVGLDETTFVMARVDPITGTINGRIHKAIGPFMLKYILATGKEAGQNDQMMFDVDLGAETWTGNLKYGSMAGGLFLGCNYFQSVTPSLAIGGEGLYVGANGNMLSSYTAKYSSANYLACINYNMGQQMITCHYKNEITPKRVSFGAELQFCPLSIDQSTVMLGMEYAFARSKLSMSVDGGGKLQTVLETKLGKERESPSLTLSGEIDHANDTMRFGYGFSIS